MWRSKQEGKNSMNEAELKKKQFEAFEIFFKKVVFNRVDVMGIVAFVCCLILLVAAMTMPGYKMLGIWWAIVLFGTCEALLGISFYIGVNRKGQYWLVYWKLQNLPISLQTIREFRFRKLLKFQTKLYLPLQVLHIIATLIRAYPISWEDFAYPLLFLFVIPVMLTGMYSKLLP